MNKNFVLIYFFQSLFPSSEERYKSLNKTIYVKSPLGMSVVTISDDDYYYYKFYESQMNSINAHRSITIRCGLRFFYTINYYLINNVFSNYLK